MSEANRRQVGGAHYGSTPGAIQHWDIVVQHDLNYFEGQITKYVMRARKKNGLQDLQKAAHFIEKYMEEWPRLNRLPAEVVRVLPRTQQDQDDEYEIQEAAARWFDVDGYLIGGTNYQCKHCRGVVCAHSPLGAVAQHPQPCVQPKYVRPVVAPADKP